MKKSSLTALGVIVATGFLLSGGVYAYIKWSDAQPTKENFDKAARSIWERDVGRRTKDLFGDPVSDLCINVPSHPAPDSKSKSQRPLAWHLDFYLDPLPSQRREKQLRQLDALSKVGLLERSNVTTNVNGELKKAIRYSLTEAGWAATGYSRRATCFIYGTLRYLGVSEFKPRIISNPTGLEVYDVLARIGLSSESDIAPWAKGQDIQTEFDEIKKSIEGREYPMLLVRGGGKWVDYKTLAQEQIRQKNGRIATQERPALISIYADAKRKIEEQNVLPTPTPEDIKNILQATHGPDQRKPNPSSCLYLPGSEKLPVDKDLTTSRPLNYSVAIYTNKERKPYDRVAKKTIPYLDSLEKLGVLSKRPQNGLLGEGKDAGKLFGGQIYELTPSFKSRIDSTYPNCFQLGEPSLEFIDIQISDYDSYGLPSSSFRYKVRVFYRDPPSWMRDPMLIGSWSELRGVIEDGMACEGKFEFNRKTRNKSNGGGSCWWAFDSYYENY